MRDASKDPILYIHSRQVDYCNDLQEVHLITAALDIIRTKELEFLTATETLNHRFEDSRDMVWNLIAEKAPQAHVPAESSAPASTAALLLRVSFSCSITSNFTSFIFPSLPIYTRRNTEI